jgi:hypothetical protein
MRFRRAIIAVLLTIALPHAAVASILDGGRCHHGQGDAHAAQAPAQHDHAAMQHDHASMTHGHHAAAALSGHAGCDCPLKCNCASHCGSGGGSAALTLRPLEIAAVDRDTATIGSYRALPADARDSPAFRPPIAALPGAA